MTAAFAACLLIALERKVGFAPGLDGCYPVTPPRRLAPLPLRDESCEPAPPRFIEVLPGAGRSRAFCSSLRLSFCAPSPAASISKSRKISRASSSSSMFEASASFTRLIRNDLSSGASRNSSPSRPSSSFISPQRFSRCCPMRCAFDSRLPLLTPFLDASLEPSENPPSRELPSRLTL